MANVIDIVVRAKDATAGTLKSVNSKIKKFRNNLRRSFGELIKFAKSTATAIAVVGGAIVAASVKAVQAYREQAQAEAKLEAISKATGFAHGFTTNEIKRQAAELQKLTGVGDDVIISMQGMLASFKNIRGDAFEEATIAVLDMGAAMRKAGKDTADIEAAAIQVGKALNDPIKGMSALSRVGVTFTDDQREMVEQMQEAGDLAGAQAVILKELQGEFGGTAEAMGQASHGLDQLKARLGDAMESIGKAIVENDAFDSSIRKITKSLDDLVESGDLEAWASGVGEGFSKLIQKANLVGKAFSITGKIAKEITLIGTVERVGGMIQRARTGGIDLAESDREVRQSRRRLDQARQDAAEREEMRKAEEQRQKEAEERREARWKKALAEQMEADGKAHDAMLKEMERGEAALDRAAEKRKNLTRRIEENAKAQRAFNAESAASTLDKAAGVHEKNITALQTRLADVAMTKEERREKEREARQAGRDLDREKRLMGLQESGVGLSKRDREFLKARELQRRIQQQREQKEAAEARAAEIRRDEQNMQHREQMDMLGDIRRDLRDNLQAV